MENTTVFLSDWQVLFREGIHFTLSGEEDITVIGESTSNEEALDFIKTNAPDIVILNANHSEFSGINLTRHIRRNIPSISVILIMDSDNTETCLSALKYGANACITKNINPDEIIDLIREINNGRNPISKILLKPEVASRITEEFNNFAILSKEVDNLLASLSVMESGILKLAEEGISIEQISVAKGISETAIRHHLDMIVTKLIGNNHDREVIEAAQNKVTALFTRIKRSKKESDYISRDEFDAFKESIKERFKNLANGLG